MTTCYLCADQRQDVQRSGIAKLYGENTLRKSFLWQDDSLYLTPAPGCLTPGYMILATKAHLNRFAELPAQVLKRVAELYEQISSFGILSGLDSYVMFEHGGANPSRPGAACISHAHMHVAPSPSPNELLDSLRARFPETVHSSILELLGIKDGPAYILFCSKDSISSFKCPVAPSQFLRQLLSRQCGVAEQWDWRDHPFVENYEKTINLFSPVLKGDG